MISVDRPSPTNNEYKFKKYKIIFTWGEPKSQIPISATVEITDFPDFDVFPTKIWESYEGAHEDVVVQIHEYIDKNIS